MSFFVDIRKQYGDFLLDVQLQAQNSIVGFLGASGCGKSLTLKCIAGIETPDSGKIIVNGRTLFDGDKRINVKPQDRKIGYLFQNYALFPHMTVEQNIMCGLSRIRNREERKRRTDEMMKKMVLTGLEKHLPKQLSGGQQQRTALARILASEPELLLLDEPFSALDSHLRLKLETEMKTILQEYQHDVIFVSHDRDEVYRLCDKIAIYDNGQISGFGNVKAIFRYPPSSQAARLTGCKNIAYAQKLEDNKVYVPSWNMIFSTEEYVKEELIAIGIRAHYFNATTPHNVGRVQLIEQIEEPFEWIIKFRYVGADEQTEPVWWRVSKEMKRHEMPDCLGVAPQNIILLYK